MTNPYLKQYLMTAGPTPLPPTVSQVMAEPMLYHRAPAFVEVYARVLRALKVVFQTANDVQVFAASGSGAMESAVANLVRPGEPVLVASCGKFGERWAELGDAYGAQTIHWETEWGRKIDPGELDRTLAENEGVEVVFTTFSETSTGVVNDVRELAEVAHRHGALIAVDAVSAIGAVPLAQDEHGVDVVVSGSQKALMAPPGLGFVSANGAALERAAASPGRRYYFDWERTVSGQRKDPPDTPFTPAVGLIRALDVALGLIEDEGLEAVYERHRLLGRATREATRALDLDTLGEADDNAERRHRDRAARLDRRGQGAQADARPLRHHHRGRPGQAEGQDRAHRPLRLLRRLRHRRDDRRAGDDAARARPRARAGSRRRCCPARLPRRGRAGFLAGLT